MALFQVEIVTDKLRDQAFQTSALRMKKHALTIHSLSTLYSTVITDVINPGFSLAMRSPHHTEGEASLVIAQAKNELVQYLADAERRCSEFSLEVRLRRMHESSVAGWLTALDTLVFTLKGEHLLVLQYL